MPVNPTALVTGGSQRIGAAICRQLHAAEMDVVVHCNRSETQANQLAAELNQLRSGSCSVVQCDLSETVELQRMASEVLSRFPGLQMLVNNASVFFAKHFTKTAREDWQRLHRANVEAPYFLSQALAAQLAKQGGCIINITDIHSEIPLRQYSAYCASKAGLLGMTRSLALELAPNVRVNAVAPGAILWPEDNDDGSDDPHGYGEEAKKNILSRIPLGALGSAPDIAKAVKFLALDAPYITGEVINVDGGRRLSA
ncbi:MAG: pteridine reductase [Pseudomonadales bacterium]